MKTASSTPSHRLPSERGSAVLILLVLLSVMLLLVTDNDHTARWLQHQVNLVEKRQAERLAYVTTNPPPTIVTFTNRLESR